MRAHWSGGLSEVDARSVILLVEDNPSDVRLTQEALRESGAAERLYVVPDGEQAIAFLKKRNGHHDAPTPVLIILDLNLPRKDGREVLAEIKSDERLRRIPVVVLTTSTSEDDVMKSYCLHANCFVTKPIELEKFIDAIQSIRNFWLTTATLPSLAA
ncbi:MAG TPA: response regulator [Thermoanaerobaculia bacterium]